MIQSVSLAGGAAFAVPLDRRLGIPRTAAPCSYRWPSSSDWPWGSPCRLPPGDCARNCRLLEMKRQGSRTVADEKTAPADQVHRHGAAIEANAGRGVAGPVFPRSQALAAPFEAGLLAGGRGLAGTTEEGGAALLSRWSECVGATRGFAGFTSFSALIDAVCPVRGKVCWLEGLLGGIREGGAALGSRGSGSAGATDGFAGFTSFSALIGAGCAGVGGVCWLAGAACGGN